ncbi:DUF202 domain-containing protein [Rhodococcus opacus]|jgi:hypothetical protein|uniref:DUF202 domain-containing protein n=1 Tax=Rhodococcus opacus TaxID=37919 RepID=UPI0024765FB7|nr:DUF202 domain-containing protein [Rhodococcus opacus]MDH6287745.1 hypothetical protein [Rhodococcus opacus]
MSVHHSIDAGLQPERTSLSFVRTCLSILGLVVACLRWLPPSHPMALVGPAIAGTLVAGAAVHEHRSRPLRRARFAAESATPTIGTGSLLAVSVALLSLSGLWVLVH